MSPFTCVGIIRYLPCKVGILIYCRQEIDTINAWTHLQVLVLLDNWRKHNTTTYITLNELWMLYFPIGTSLCVDSNWVIKRINLVLNLYIKSGSPNPSKSFLFVNTFYHFNFCDKYFLYLKQFFFINSLWIDLGLPRLYYLRQPTLGCAEVGQPIVDYSKDIKIDMMSVW